MNALDKIKSAQIAANLIISGFTTTVNATPDATEARKAELMTAIKEMKSSDKIDYLVNRILELEKPKSDNKVKTEDVAKALMESKECAVLTWGDIASLIQNAGLGEKTSAASIASYASKRKADWSIVPREKMRFNSADLLAYSQLAQTAVVEQSPAAVNE